ncbi:hypothetical protein N7495_004135 [Penicillium taxi]|uniref:uncharacterized protein n=1 Tax=Penicillium taxi TaxID=168475 RepID=UPI00254522E1|nr:uncharacterized protein N7495_004135 [Penicillium taxi]KAJ5899391.1 hypothetical protein N7495_004135 [Penicillium taxi]
MPTASGLPDSLIPTQSQMSINHSGWINMIPFPQMRENLIRWEGSFIHWDFVSDIIGSILEASLFAQSGNSISARADSDAEDIKFISKANQDDDASERNGLVVWGEPYIPENWEVTPGFLTKWAWTMHGCHELIASTNHWRMIRGEKKLRFPIF